MSLENDSNLKIAKSNIDILLEIFPANESLLAHTYKDGVCKNWANLEDYAFLKETVINVFQVDFDQKYLKIAD